MKTIKNLTSSLAVIVMLTTVALADHVTVDYDHKVNFLELNTYSWAKVQTANSIWDSRVKEAIDRELAAKGWTQVPSGGNVSIVAVEKIHTDQEVETFYNGFGGWRWGGSGDATSRVEKYKVGTLVLSLFDGNSKQLIWRGTSSSDLSGDPGKNAKKLDTDIHKMFKRFPPRTSS